MKKALFITTSFYPDPYVASVRTKEFCRWLPEYGWKPHVLTKDYGHRVSEREFVSAVNEETEVHYLNKFVDGAISSGAGAKGPKARVVSFLANYILAPDVSVIFWRKQSRKIIELVNEINPDVVITTGPPHSIHLTGMVLKKQWPDMFWVADFRDEFRNGKGYKGGITKSLLNFYSWTFEKKVYRIADGLIFAIPTHRRWVRLKSPEADKKAKLILNGSPVELDPQNSVSGLNGKKTYRTITVVGFNDAPESLVLAKAVRRMEGEFRLKFIGPTPPQPEEIKRVLGDHVEFIDSLPHNAVVEELKKADILVGILSYGRSRRVGISSKMFEYTVMPVPIMLLNPTRPDKKIFCDLAGVYLSSDTTEQNLFSMLCRLVEVDAAECFERATGCYEKWNRKKQTHELVRLLDGFFERI